MHKLHDEVPTYANGKGLSLQANIALLALGLAGLRRLVHARIEGAFCALHLIRRKPVIDDLSRTKKGSADTMRHPRLKTHGVVCGSVTTAVVTLAVSAGWLPTAWNGASEAAALTGLLATLAAAFGLCDQYEDRQADLENQKDKEL